MNSKTESNFLIMFSMVGHIWIRDGRRVKNHCLNTQTIEGLMTRHTWNQINNQHEGETGSHGAKTHTGYVYMHNLLFNRT